MFGSGIILVNQFGFLRLINLGFKCLFWVNFGCFLIICWLFRGYVVLFPGYVVLGNAPKLFRWSITDHRGGQNFLTPPPVVRDSKLGLLKVVKKR